MKTIEIIIHSSIIVLELIGIYLSYRHVRWQIFIYYTEISNFLTLVSSLLYLAGGDVVLLRYVSSCMLTMTALVSLFVLSPASGGIRENMLSGECLYHHTLIPLISVSSYVLLERHSGLWQVPVVITFMYGMIMILLNHLGWMEGPYDFLMIRKNGIKATAGWIAVLLMIISAISAGIMFIAG